MFGYKTQALRGLLLPRPVRPVSSAAQKATRPRLPSRSQEPGLNRAQGFPGLGPSHCTSAQASVPHPTRVPNLPEVKAAPSVEEGGDAHPSVPLQQPPTPAAPRVSTLPPSQTSLASLQSHADPCTEPGGAPGLHFLGTVRSLTWLAKSRWHTVWSFGSFMTARITCSIGVMPVKQGPHTLSGCLLRHARYSSKKEVRDTQAWPQTSLLPDASSHPHS